MQGPEFHAKDVTHLQIIGCNLHKNVFGGARNHWEAVALPNPSRYKGGREGGKEKERAGNSKEGKKRERNDVNGKESCRRNGRERGVGYLLDLDICPVDPEFLVTPLAFKRSIKSSYCPRCSRWQILSTIMAFSSTTGPIPRTLWPFNALFCLTAGLIRLILLSVGFRTHLNLCNFIPFRFKCNEHLA